MEIVVAVANRSNPFHISDRRRRHIWVAQAGKLHFLWGGFERREEAALYK